MCIICSSMLLIAQYLFRCDGEWSNGESSLGAAANDAIEHSIGKHGREEETEAARQTLDAGETTRDWTSNNGKPDVVISKTLVRLPAEQVTSVDHLLMSADWNQSTDLNTQQKNCNVM